MDIEIIKKDQERTLLVNGRLQETNNSRGMVPGVDKADPWAGADPSAVVEVSLVVGW
jgi:hypothetical protein